MIPWQAGNGRRRSNPTSPALARTRPNGRLSRQLGFVLLRAVGLALLLRRSDRTIRPDLTILFPLGMVTLWAMMSIAWSADPAITLKRQIILVFTLLAVLGLVKQFDIKMLAEMAFAITLGVVLIGVAAEAAFAPDRSS